MDVAAGVSAGRRGQILAAILCMDDGLTNWLLPYSDRMVLGLALNDAGEEPFLAYFDREGVKHTLLGKW